MPCILTNYNLIKSEPKNSDELNSITFQNVFAGYFSMVMQRHAIYQGLQEEGVELQGLLDTF